MPMAKRGPRARALQSNPAIFAGGIDYAPVAGIPRNAGIPEGKYNDAAEAARPRSVPPVTPPKSLKVKG